MPVSPGVGVAVLGTGADVAGAGGGLAGALVAVPSGEGDGGLDGVVTEARVVLETVVLGVVVLRDVVLISNAEQPPRTVAPAPSAPAMSVRRVIGVCEGLLMGPMFACLAN